MPGLRPADQPCMFEWKPCYCLDIEVVDSQHRNLFRLATELQAAIEAGRSQQVVAGLLDSIVQDVQMHFQQEERMMQEVNYPNLAAHKGEHDAILLQVGRLQQEFRSGGIALNLEFLQFLNNWLDMHIMQHDKLYVPYLQAPSVA